MATWRREKNDKVSGKTLTSVCEKLGIKSQAMRVALHKLRKDGWIGSTKSGRHSAYYLTDMSRAESAKASPRIYSKSAPTFTGFDLLIAPKEISFHLNHSEWFQAGSEIYVRFSEQSSEVKNTLISRHNDPLPNWLSERLIPTEIVQDYKCLHHRLKAVSTERWPELSAHEVAALRVLLVHSWRRLILKHPPLSAEAFPTSCPFGECHTGLNGLLNQLPAPPLDDLT